MPLIRSFMYNIKAAKFNPLTLTHNLSYTATGTYLRVLKYLVKIKSSWFREHITETYHSKVIRLEDANRIMQLIQGTDVRTSVWPFTTFDCSLFQNTPPLAEGFVDLVNTDNDLLVFLNPNNVNHNAFGFTAHGQLNGPNGEQMQFGGVFRSVWDGNDPSTLREVIRINLN